MTEETSRRITVKLRKSGWEVEITCTEGQIKQAIESVLSSLEAPTSSSSHPIHGPGEANATGNKTCRGLILELWQEGWFSQARALSDVHEEIARRGYHYDRTAVSHSLTDLVRENILTRQGNMRNYTYIQKRPPSIQQALGSSKTQPPAQEPAPAEEKSDL